MDKPRLNRLSTARCDPPSVYIGFRLFVLPKSPSGQLFTMLWRQAGRLSPGRTDQWASSPARPCPAPPHRRAPPRPDPPVVRPGFWIQLVLNSTLVDTKNGALVESKTRTYHGRVGSGQRTAGQRGGAEPGRTGHRRIGSIRGQLSLFPSKASSTTVLHVSSEARTSEIRCKPMEDKNVVCRGSL